MTTGFTMWWSQEPRKSTRTARQGGEYPLGCCHNTCQFLWDGVQCPTWGKWSEYRTVMRHPALRVWAFNRQETGIRLTRKISRTKHSHPSGKRRGTENAGFPKYRALGCEQFHLNIKGDGDLVWLDDLRHQDSYIYREERGIFFKGKLNIRSLEYHVTMSALINFQNSAHC